MYITVESLSCTLETNIVNYNKKIFKRGYEDCPDCVHRKSRRIQTALTQQVSLSRPLGTRSTHKSQLYYILATDTWKLKLKNTIMRASKAINI